MIAEIDSEKLHFHQFKTLPWQTGQAWHEWRAEQLSEQFGFRVNPEDVRIHQDRCLHDARLQPGTDGGIIGVGEWSGFTPGARAPQYGKAEPKGKAAKVEKSRGTSRGLFAE